MSDSAQRPVEIILARGVMSNLGVPALLVDVGGGLVFVNDLAAAVLGVRFEETGAMSAAQWVRRFALCDGEGRAVPAEELPPMIALQRERPAHRCLWIRSATGEERQVEVVAFPIVANAVVRGAMAVFWDAPAADRLPA